MPANAWMIFAILSFLFCLMGWGRQASPFERSPLRADPITPDDEFKLATMEVKDYRRNRNYVALAAFFFGLMAIFLLEWHWIGTALLFFAAVFLFRMHLKVWDMLEKHHMRMARISVPT